MKKRTGSDKGHPCHNRVPLLIYFKIHTKNRSRQSASVSCFILKKWIRENRPEFFQRKNVHKFVNIKYYYYLCPRKVNEV